MNQIDHRSRWLMAGLFTAIIIVALLRDVSEPHPVHMLPASPPPRARNNPSPVQLFDRAFRFSALVLPLRARGYVTVVRSIAGITTIVGLGLILLLLIGRRIERMAHVLRLNVGMTFLLGLALVVGASLFTVLAIISLVAVAVVPLIGLGLCAVGTIGVLVVAVTLGQTCRSLVTGDPSLVADLITGVLLLAFVLVLPLVGAPLLLLAVLWGTGAVALSRGGSI